MTALAATDVSVTLPGNNRNVVAGKKNSALATLVFGDGAKTYPTGGIPLPAIGHFGLKKELQAMFIQEPLTAYIYRFDPTNHKLKIYEQGGAALTEISSSDTPAETTMVVLVIGV